MSVANPWGNWGAPWEVRTSPIDPNDPANLISQALSGAQQRAVPNVAPIMTDWGTNYGTPSGDETIKQYVNWSGGAATPASTIANALKQGNGAQAAATAGYTDLPGWSYGGDQIGGASYVEGRGWVNPQPVAAGTDIGINSGTTTGVKLPVSYNGAQDTYRSELNGKFIETAWSKVARAASDAIRNGQDPNVAMNNMITAVNADAARQGKTTGFGAPGAPQTPQAAPQAPQATPQATAQASTAGGYTAPALTPQGTTGGAGMADIMGSGRTAAQQAAGQIGASAGGAATGGGQLGPAGSVLATRDPATAYAAYRSQNGLSTTSRSKYADFKESLFGQAISALLNLSTTQNPGVTNDNINDLIGQFSGAVKGGNMFGLLGGAAQSALGRVNMGGMNDADTEKLLKLATGAIGLGQSSIGSSALNTNLDDLLAQQQRTDLSTDFESPALGTTFANSPLARAIAALGGR